jgi:hypothetical protein
MSIEGIPTGWKPVRFGYVEDGQKYMSGLGDVVSHQSSRPTQAMRLIVEEIRKDTEGEKRYREPVDSDLFVGNPEVEVSNHADGPWMSASLCMIAPEHVENRYVTVHLRSDGGFFTSCWKHCRIEDVYSKIETNSLEIPEGWRELQEGETRHKADRFWWAGGWFGYIEGHYPEGSVCAKYDRKIHLRHIRKIEPEVTARHDSEGRDVTNLPGLHDDGDTQYREPTTADLKNGPIVVEACTPHPVSKLRVWRERVLVGITEGIGNSFVVEHPGNKGMVVCYKEARIKIGSTQVGFEEIKIGDRVLVVGPRDASSAVGWNDKYMNRFIGCYMKVSGVVRDPKKRFFLEGGGGWRFRFEWLQLQQDGGQS